MPLKIQQNQYIHVVFGNFKVEKAQQKKPTQKIFLNGFFVISKFKLTF